MTATVSCVDVGQGDCTVVVDLQTGEGLLIDCRDGKSEAALAEFETLGLTELRAAVVSHTHCDHFGGVLDVVEGLAEKFTGALYVSHDSLMAMPVAGEDRKERGMALRALFHRAREFPGRVRHAEVGAFGTAGSVEWILLAPTYDEVLAAVDEGDPNLASGVVRLQAGDEYLIVAGDAQLSTWQRIENSLSKGAVVRWPHHGGSLSKNEPTADELVFALLEPSAVIVSVGSTNTHAHPTAPFFGARAAIGTRLLCTQATPQCVAGGGNGGTCAGTVRVALGAGGLITTEAADHPAVVAAFGNAQCL